MFGLVKFLELKCYCSENLNKFFLLFALCRDFLGFLVIKMVKKELQDVAHKWSIVYKFYLNIEKGGLPKIVFSSTDKITQKMDDIVGMYVPLLKDK